MTFDWDTRKNAINEKKHGVPFREAATAFYDPNRLIEEDDEHSVTEQRYRLIGFSTRGRLLALIYTERHDANRIISAKKADGQEQAAYAARLASDGG